MGQITLNRAEPNWRERSSECVVEKIHSHFIHLLWHPANMHPDSIAHSLKYKTYWISNVLQYKRKSTHYMWRSYIFNALKYFILDVLTFEVYIKAVDGLSMPALITSPYSCQPWTLKVHHFYQHVAYFICRTFSFKVTNNHRVQIHKVE